MLAVVIDGNSYMQMTESKGQKKKEVKEEEEFLSEGDIVYDEDRLAEYEVTAVNGNEAEVEYIEPVNKKASEKVGGKRKNSVDI